MSFAIHIRPLRVRIVFLAATALLMVFAFLLVALGLTNVNNAAVTMSESIEMTEELLTNAGSIANNLQKVGLNSRIIRDAAVAELNNLCPADPNIADSIGMDINDIAASAQSDLTRLADFIQDGLEALGKNILVVRSFVDGADAATQAVEFWDWEMKLLASGLFILPSFLAVGVGLVMLDMDVKSYQRALTYFFMPLFIATTIASFIVCCAMLPVSASSADACSGGGNVRGGVDDTVLTIYRNLRGDDSGSKILQFVGYYTQRCNPEYYPFDFLGKYLNDLDNALESTNLAVSTVAANQAMLEEKCDRKFDSVLEVVDDMNDNLKLLRQQADRSLDLVKCENINKLYVVSFSPPLSVHALSHCPSNPLVFIYAFPFLEHR